MSAPRIISLIASATEIACALGHQPNLVGRSHECDYPPGVEDLPVCTAPKLNVDARSGEIDRQVKSLVAQALSVYRVDAERLRELRPDLILTQTQCEVCAVSLKDVEQAVCGWVDSRPSIVSLAPNALAEVWEDFRRVARALGTEGRGEKVVGDLQRRMRAIAARASKLEPKPTVACLEWIDPLMAAGNWMPELVEMAGGCNLFGEAGKHSPWMSWEDLLAKDPDVVVVLPCGFGLERTRLEMAHLTRRTDWHKLRAAREGRVFLADGHQYFNRPGPRLSESLEILAEILHPREFQFGHKGSAWYPLS